MTRNLFRVLSMNLEHNGRDRDGSTTRWEKAMKIVVRMGADVVLRQELTRADMHGCEAKWQEAERLGGYFPFMASATKESANPTGVFINPRRLRPLQEFEHVTGLWHPICNPAVALVGAAPGARLALASFHLCYWDPDKRVSEARRLLTLGRPGMEAILGGDCNSYPHAADEADTLPDWGKVKNRSHFEQRTVLSDEGIRVSDTRPDAILAGRHGDRPGVFVELGQYAVQERGQSRETALAPTASLWRTDQGPRQRIDRIYSTPGIARAFLGLEVLDSPEVAEATDHALVLATFDWDMMREILSEPAAAA
ncbi:endonuclease/exonuclease/phosphatase family protein [Streptomyces longispororuber]|uniref:endonuclease/exonuclease/phosphatase family protein n=1 Tax=Streptomyces longispororuber TaxID=68230 RepID=UPI0036FB1422